MYKRKNIPATCKKPFVFIFSWSYKQNKARKNQRGICNLTTYETQERIQIRKYGLFIDKDFFFLGVSPDGVIWSWKCATSTRARKIKDWERKRARWEGRRRRSEREMKKRVRATITSCSACLLGEHLAELTHILLAKTDSCSQSGIGRTSRIPSHNIPRAQRYQRNRSIKFAWTSIL